MNWEAIGAVGELLGAAAVVFTLGYLAVQVRHAKTATADQSRLYRANAVQELILQTSRDEELRMLQTKAWGFEQYYLGFAEELGITIEQATKLDWGNCYYFWMWRGQYACTTESKDMKELEHIVATMGGIPSMRAHWENSPISRPMLDSDYVKFVDAVLAKQ